MTSIKNGIRFKCEEIHPVKCVDSFCPSIEKEELRALFVEEKKKFLLPTEALKDIDNNKVYIYCNEVTPVKYDGSISIDLLYFLKLDLEELKKKHDFLSFIPVKIFDNISFETEMKRLHAEISDYKNTISRLTSEIEESRRRHKTSSATEGKAARTAGSWACYLETAVLLANHCFNNPKEYTIEELKDICASQEYGKLPREALNAFRKGMPKNFIKEQGAPLRKE